MVARLLPGVALLAAIGLAGKWAETSGTALVRSMGWDFPKVEYVLWAILFGSIVSNLFGARPWFRRFEPGIATYELWLKLGIVLLGVRFVLGDLARLGGLSLGLVAIEIAVAIAIMIGFGRLFGLGPKLIALLAVGSSICGVSAIIATKGAIEASDEDASFAIAAIIALGAAGLFLYPPIAHALGLSDHAFGMWAGLAVDNTAEAAATGAIYSETAGRVAVLAKTARNATIGIVVLVTALYFAARERRVLEGSKAAFVWSRFPKFVLGFLILSTLATVGALRPVDLTNLANLSRWAFLLTFAGVGLRINLAELRRQGVRPFVVGACAELSVALVTLVLVAAVDRFIGF